VFSDLEGLMQLLEADRQYTAGILQEDRLELELRKKPDEALDGVSR
jgi:hypothetical protein